MMAQTDTAGGMAGTTRSRVGVGVWIFRALVVAGAAFMVYTWFQPWWNADIAVIKGENDMVLHPWGVEVVKQVRMNTDVSQYEMPGFFAPLMWAYLSVSMLALAAALFLNRQISIGRFKLPLAVVLIGLVGLSYLAAPLIAYEIGTLRAGWAGANFIGKSTIIEPQSDAKIKMVSDLEIGFWLSVGSGGFLLFLALVRGLFVRKPKQS